MTIIDHLRDAEESLESAKEKSGIGTSFMIGSILSDLRKLITRTENIKDEHEIETDER